MALLAEAGHRDLATFSIGFHAAGGESGDEFTYSDLVAEQFGTDHHQIRIAHERLLPALDGAVAAMSEPMVSHDCVAFYLLSQEVSQHVKVVQSGQGADEVFAGTTGIRRCRRAPGAVDAYAKVFFDRRTRRLAGAAQPRVPAGRRRQPRLRRGALRRARRGDRARRGAAARHPGDAVDDPVKRVDNMTMAWGLEAGPRSSTTNWSSWRGLPARAEAGRRRKGRVEGAARGIVPDEVIDRHQGVLPGARDQAFVRSVPRAWCARRCTIRRRSHVDCSGRPPRSAAGRAERTPYDYLGASARWQLALLELWLRRTERRPNSTNGRGTT